MGKVKVYIVEDERIIALDLSSTLKKNGYEISGMSASGERALVDIAADKPDIIIMDIFLEGIMDGIETAMHIKKNFNIPVIYYTSNNDIDTLNKIKQTTPYGYIIKPFDEKSVIFTIETAMIRHSYEKKVEDNKNLMLAIMNSTTDGLIAINNAMDILMINNSANNLTGNSNMGFIGEKIFDYLETKIDYTEYLLEVFNSGEKIVNKETMLINRKDSSEKLISLSIFPIFSGTGENTFVENATILLRDISIEKFVENERMKSQKLDALSILAGGIAHDFNNLLTVILGNTSIAKMSDMNISKEDLLVFDEIEKASYRARSLTQQLLTFSKGGIPVKKTASIADLLNEAVTFILSGSKVKANFHIDSNLSYAEIDEGQIYQVFQNLTINAVQSMPSGGWLTVGAENYSVMADNQLNLKKGKYVKISISDVGDGIPKEIINKIFDPYFTTKKAGSGLGLAVSYSIVKNHSGMLTVDSEFGKGTTFNIYLPSSDKTPDMIEIDNEEFVGKGCVIVVDDQIPIRELAKKMLEKLHFTVLAFSDSKNAIETYKKMFDEKREVYAVILDLTMPADIGGIEIQQGLLKIHKSVKSIISTGMSTSSIVNDYKDFGFFNVLLKPYTISDLIKSIR